MDMKEHVARCLCATAGRGPDFQYPKCIQCQDQSKCELWYTFVHEADAAIESVRDYAQLAMRKKPRIK